MSLSSNHGGGGGRNSGGGAYSGTGYDRWAYEHSAPGANDTPLNKLQHKYWVTKQAVQRKLGRDEDEHIVASDSELDAKLELFRSIEDTTCGLQRWIEHYQDRLCNLAYEENAMGRFLKENGKADRTKAGKMMVAVGKTMCYSGQQRLAIRVPLVRLYQEVETFRQRAIEDTGVTVRSMEKSRTGYRGALMWMKNVSQELDPDTYKQLEKFRKVQGHVKQSKARFDKYKLDCLQKVDLLAASRCNMFSHALIMYQNALILFWEKTAKTMTHVNDSFEGYQHFEFSYIKDLVEPSRNLADTTKKSKRKDAEPEAQKSTKDTKDEKYFFDPDYKDEPSSSQPSSSSQAAKPQREAKDKSSGDGATFSNLIDISSGVNNLASAGNEQAASKADDALLNFGVDDELLESPTDPALQCSDKDLEAMSLLKPAQPMSQPTDQDDALLLEELMNGPPGAAAPSGDDGAGIGGGGGSNGFSAQWSALLASKKQDPSPEAEFTDLMASHASAATAPLQQPTSSSLQPQSATQQQQQQGGFLLPSQLFDMDQSLYSGKRSTAEEDLLRDFPMPSPARPATVKKKMAEEEMRRKSEELEDDAGPAAGGKKAATKKQDMSQWFSLFADLDPLANPDAIGKTTKEVDKNCYS